MKLESIIEIEQNEQHFDVLVIADYEPACKGSRDIHGQQNEPNVPASIRIISITAKDGTEIELDSTDMWRAENELWQLAEFAYEYDQES